jgi:hypothetical protein
MNYPDPVRRPRVSADVCPNDYLKEKIVKERICNAMLLKEDIK